MPSAPWVSVGPEVRLLHHAPTCPHDDKSLVVLLWKLPDSLDRRDPFAVCHPHQIGNGFSFSCGTDVRNLVYLQPVDPSPIRENQDVGVGGRDEQLGEEILLACPHSDTAFAAAPLVSILGDRRPFHVPRIADCDRHVFFSDQILDTEITSRLENLSAPVIPVGLLNGQKLGDDDLHEQLFAFQNRSKALDGREQLRQFVNDLLPLEAREALQLHVQNRLRLKLRQREVGDQPAARLGRCPSASDELDDCIELVEGDLEAFKDMSPSLCLP